MKGVIEHFDRYVEEWRLSCGILQNIWSLIVTARILQHLSQWHICSLWLLDLPSPEDVWYIQIRQRQSGFFVTFRNLRFTILCLIVRFSLLHIVYAPSASSFVGDLEGEWYQVWDTCRAVIIIYWIESRHPRKEEGKSSKEYKTVYTYTDTA
jgi:hypothetical protein